MIRSVVNLFRRWIAGKPQRPSEGHAGQFVYHLPFPSGESYPIVQGYGGTYSHTGEDHFSIDFGMPEGTSVCAARDGVVYHVTDYFAEGGTHPSFKPKANVVRVLHNDDTIATYAHLAHHGACVRPGDFVASGQVIGFSGSTGWSGSPHLHFHIADAITQRHIPTIFHAAYKGITTLEAGVIYTAATENKVRKPRPRAEVSPEVTVHERDPFAYHPELLDLSQGLTVELSAAGYELMSDYSSVEAQHDIYGVEVCGVRSPEATLEIVRLLLYRFPGWNAGWYGPPDGLGPEGWVAQIQRDRDAATECWDVD